MLKYITLTIGELYISPPLVLISDYYEQTSNTTPVVIILTKGSDPMSDIMRLAEEVGRSPNEIHLVGVGIETSMVRSFLE